MFIFNMIYVFCSWVKFANVNILFYDLSLILLKSNAEMYEFRVLNQYAVLSFFLIVPKAMGGVL